MAGADIRGLIRQATATLSRAGVGSPRVDAELLLAHVLATSRSGLLTATATEEQARAFDRLLARRAAREPLQHLTGRAPFRHLELSVGPGVFIPRPETELVLDLAAAGLATADRVVDLCSGSGALALAIAQEFGPDRVIAVERSEAALAWLRRNADERAAAGDRRVEIVPADVAAFDAGELTGRVDVVVANPPYVPSGQRGELDAEIGFDPEDAVFSGPAGLDLMPHVIALAARLLRGGGLFVVEHDAGHELGASFGDGWSEVTAHRDLTGRPRFTSARRS